MAGICMCAQANCVMAATCWRLKATAEADGQAYFSADPEAVLMARYGVAARDLADALWAVSGDIDAMTRVVERHHQDARRRAGNS